MCGIAGVMRIDPARAEPILPGVTDRMLQLMRRRGPDGEGQWRSGDGICWLGHRRLAVIDLSTGDQPMTNEDGTLWAVYNGEIYNYKVLRTELRSRGHQFKTVSDTEVLLHGFEEWGGTGLTQRLRGIFAFAIYDSKTKLLFLARDHLGVKPLHWWSDGRTFVFASEMKSLLEFPGVKREVNTAGVAQFLVTRYVSRPHTIFRSINRLPEASLLEVGFGQRQPPIPKIYWDVKYKAPSSTPGSRSYDATEGLDALLKETVSMQLMSDVPIGAQLSGGVDSSVIVALMELTRRENGGKGQVKTFSVGFDVEKFSELAYARLVAERYKTDHHEIVLSARDFIRELPLLCWLYDEPMGEAPAVPTYLMCKMAKETENVTVMLCGEGADEQFGGYRKYLFERASSYLKWMPGGVRSAVLRGLGSLLPFNARRLRAIVEILALQDRSARFASWYGAMDTTTQASVLRSDLQREVGESFLRDVFDPIIANCDSKGELETFLYCDIHTRLVDTLLVKADRMSMAASVESRVPFLDPRVVSFAAGLPTREKVKGLETKVILKKLAERYAPNENIYRRKVGFVMPLSDWFRGPLRNFVRDMLLTDRSFSRGYYQPEVLRRIVDEHLDGAVDREQGIWVLLALELWHRLYVDADGGQAEVERLQGALEPITASLAIN